MRPPRLARALVRLAFPPDVRAAAVGDLDEEFTTHILPERGRAVAVAWYWRQAVASMPAAIRLRLKATPNWRQRSEYTRGLLTDARYGFRLLYKYPSFSLAVVATHGLGVSVTCAVVSIVYALLRPLPYAHPERLVHLYEQTADRQDASGQSSYPDFVELRRTGRSFEQIGGYSGGSRTITGPGAPPERVPIAEVTDGFFEALGIEPVMGRRFEAADERRDAPPVVILTDGIWRRRFGADPSVIGRTLTLNGAPHAIIGVLPRGFEFPLRGLAQLWLPMRPSRAQEERQYFHWLNAIARLKPGVTEEQARDDLDAVARRLRRSDPRYHAQSRLISIPLHEEVLGPLRSPMLILIGAVVLVMFVTCANVAGLLLARAAGRDREISIRVAVGASHGRVARQLLVESLLLGVPGTLLGVGAGHLASRVFVGSLPAAERAALPNVQNVMLDPMAAAISVAVALLSALLFGTAPAWRFTRTAPAAASLGSGRSSMGAGEGHLRGALASAQVALALMLLAGAGLVGKSVYRLLQVSPGFDATNVLTLQVNLPEPRYGNDQALAFHDGFLERVRALPGVVGAESIDRLPLTGRGNNGTFSVDGQPSDPAAESTRSTAIRAVSPGYFSVMRVPILAGRTFANETRTSAPVVVVNRTFAERFFGGAPLGHRISFVFFSGRPRWEIIGVVGDEQFVALDREPIPVVYFTVAQDAPGAFSLVVRAQADSASLTASIRAVAAQMDPLLPIYGVRTMERIMAESRAVFTRRLVLSLLALFAAATVLLAAMGVYGVLAQSVTCRTREIGVRVALGAARRDVVRLILTRGLTPVVVGVLIGLPATLAVARTLRTLLFAVAPSDAATLATVVLTILVVATLACVIPTRRAVRIDPATAIRQE